MSELLEAGASTEISIVLTSVCVCVCVCVCGTLWLPDIVSISAQILTLNL